MNPFIGLIILKGTEECNHEIHLPDNMTAINTYPIVLNALFGTEIQLQEDRAFFSSMGSPFRLREVSLQLGLAKEQATFENQ